MEDNQLGPIDMHPDFADITSRLGTPLWYFKGGVPRYDQFSPEMTGIYDEHVALCIIRCQACHRTFNVSASVDHMSHMERDETGKMAWHDTEFPTPENPCWFDTWGDPPRHDGCVGETMTSKLLSIVEFWSKDMEKGRRTFMEFVRRPEYEFNYEFLLTDEVN